MNKQFPLQRLTLIFLLLGLLLLLTPSLFAYEDNDTISTTPADTIYQAWQLAQKSGRYAFRTHVNQTTYPLPKITNAGSQPRHQFVGIEGDINTAHNQLTLTLWQDSNFNPDQGIAVKVDNGVSYARQGQGAWQQVEGVTDIFAPANDPLGFLAGIKDVTLGENSTLDFDNAQITAQAYHFQLDGPVFAEHIRAQLERQLLAQGKLPPGIKLSTADTYKNMTGHGQLWLRQDGLPLQMVINADFPAQGEQERVTAVITTNYFNYDLATLAQASTPFLQAPIIWLATRLSPQDLIPTLALALLTLTLLTLCLLYWRTATFYRTIATLLTLSLILSPLLHTERVAAFHQDQQAQRDRHQAAQAEAETALAARETMNQPTTWQANIDAMAQLQETVNNVDLTTLINNGIDTDGDGISDFDETAYWDTDPNDTDSDGDGLEDGQEAFIIGTAPGNADTDSDQINDDLEIGGFTYAGKVWYLDPLNADSNQDGIGDGSECLVWVQAVDTYDPAAICPDIDGDNIPDVFDDDNDNDGILDHLDMAPSSQVNQTFSKDTSLQLNLQNLQTDRPVYVTFQMRPTNADNLSLSNSILDWPTGDTDGQVTRYISTTFATTANPELRSTAANANNGDVRITPMLEIRIPGTVGHYGNLPVNNSYSGSPRPAGLPAEDWLDTGKLAAYNINVNDYGPASDYRDLLLYVPVATDTDPDTGQPAAFRAKMPYFPEQGTVADPNIVDWGSNHHIRLIWLVQMITDQCINSDDDPETCDREDVLQIVHIYYETWQLTGLEVSEEHGVDVAIVYEDPTLDTNLNLDDQLIITAHNLNSTFLRGRDIDGDDIRDVRVDNLATAIPSWYDPGSGPFYLDVEPIIGEMEHADEIYRLLFTDTVSLLDTAFVGYETTIPSLLYAKETRNRVMSLAMMTQTTNLITADLNPTIVLTTTRAELTMKPYEYVDGAWTNADPQAYLERLEALLAESVFVEPVDATPSQIAILDGQRYWAQLYYTALYQGVGNIVNAGSEVIWRTSVDIPELTYEPSWPRQTFAGYSYIVTPFFQAFVAGFTTTISNLAYRIQGLATSGTFYQSFSQALSENTNATFGRSDIFVGSANIPGNLPSIGTFVVDTLLIFIAIALVATLTYLLASYLTGNKSGVQTAVLILNVISLAALSIHFFVISYALIRIYQIVVKGIQLLGQATQAFANNLANFLNASKFFTIVGFITSLAIAWGFFLFELLGPGFKGNEINKQFAIARAVSASIIAAIYFIISIILVLIGPVAVGIGTLIFILIAIIDIILYFAGKPGITERLTEEIAKALYDIDFVIANFGSEKRLSFNITDFNLADESAGFTIDNAIYPTIVVTNTIEYRRSSSDRQARRAAFAYYIQRQEKDRHKNLDGNSMRDAWIELPGRYLQFTTTLTTTFPISLSNVGLNQSTAQFYLTEAYAMPYEGCWLGESRNGCDWEYIKDSSHIAIGSELILDVFPATIQEFVNVQQWGRGPLNGITRTLTFPLQKDRDNDGLNSTQTGGADPDDTTIDSDGDLIPDLTEISQGTNPNRADSDGDTIDDRLEGLWNTDPNDIDTDDDGLTDDVEVISGWLVRTGDGNTVMRVWSNPLKADEDGDLLDDFQEFNYGFNPRVPTDPALIDTLIQIDQLEINETVTPHLLYRFDDTDLTQIFLDSSGNDLTAVCHPDNSQCPTNTTDSRYSYALAIDDQGLQITDDSIDLSGDFSLGLWLKMDSGNMGLMSFNNGASMQDESGEFTVYIGSNGKPGVRQHIISGTQQLKWVDGATSVVDGTWHHLMLTWDDTAETFTIYVDGVDTTDSRNEFSGLNPDPAVQTLKLGNTPFIGSLTGTFDDFVFYQEALTPAQINDVINGRFNVNDSLVPPGNQLRYEATISNTLPAQAANGFMVGATTPLTPALPTPALALHFDDNDRLRSFVPDTGNSTTWTCLDNSTCPTQAGSTIIFDGIDDHLDLPTMNVREENPIDWWWDKFSFTMFLRVDALPPVGQTMNIIDTTGNRPGSLDVYLDSDGWIWFDVQDTILDGHNVAATPYGDPGDMVAYYDSQIGSHTAHGIPVYEGGARLGQTIVYTFVYDQGKNPSAFNFSWLYVNYGSNPSQLHLLRYEYRGSSYDGLRFGSGTFGTGEYDVPFQGRLIRTAYYNGDFNNDGTFLQYMADSLFYGDPNDRPRLNPAYVMIVADDKTIAYIDDVTDVGQAHCTLTWGGTQACPVSANGQFSQSILFDGSDDYLSLGSLDFAQGDYTIAGWFSTTNSVAQPLLTARDPANGNAVGAAIHFNSSGTLIFDHAYQTGGVTVTLPSPTPLNDGTWHHVTAMRQGITSTLYIDGNFVATATGGGPTTNIPTLWLGSWDDTNPNYFAGQLDELVIISAAVEPASINMLMNSVWPAIEIAEDFVPFTVAALSTAVTSGTATIEPTTPNSLHTFGQEVEVAIELQQPINIPIVDVNSGNLQIFAPFEEAPGATQFENIVNANEYECPLPENCPTAGLRGIIDRAALFDGEDDHLRSQAGQMLSFAAWVKADRGVIFDTRRGHVFKGIELDMNQLRVQSGDDGEDAIATDITLLDLDIPLGQWTHLAVVINKSTNNVLAYINGAYYDTLSYPGNDPYTGEPTLGGNPKGGNYLRGYLDDFRAYDIMLSANDILALYEDSAAVMRFEFDETTDATFFADASPNRFIGIPHSQTSYDPVLQQDTTTLNPIPGTSGKIGNTALFSGTTGMSVAPADDTPLDLNDLTIMFWLNPEAAQTTVQNLISKQNSDGTTPNYALTLPANSLNLHFDAHLANCLTPITTLPTTTTLPTNQWTHVALTFDGNDGYIYLNGDLSGSQSYSNISLCQNDHPVTVGGDFNGEMDELAIYGRSMSQQEVNSIYLRELRWYRARGLQQLIIDSDVPTITLYTDYPYRAPGYTQLVVGGFDQSSSVALLDVGIKAPGSSTFSWQGAVRCEDGVAWCPFFDTALLGGEGVYDIQFRAVDQVGNETLSTIYQLIVDDTPPVASSNYNNTWIDAVPTDQELTWGITLTGTITDPMVGTVAGSGVISNVTLSLANDAGQRLDVLPQPALLTGNSWLINYTFSGEVAFGTYSVIVNGEDTMGNQSTTTVGTIHLDTRPPVALVSPTRNGLPVSNTITQSLTITGLVSELTNWRNPAVAYHFETPTNNGTFYDYSFNEVNATCTNCPSLNADQFGQALSYDGLNDSVTIPNQFNPITETFSLSLWFNPSSSGSGTRLLLQQDDGDGQGRALLYLNSTNRLGSNLGTFLGGTTIATADLWHHAALTYDGTTIRLYLNGVLQDEAAVTPEAANGDLYLGSNRATSSFFAGKIDEVAIYNQALSDYAIYNLAQQLVHGVQNVQVGFNLVDFTALTNTVTNTLRTPLNLSAQLSPTLWLTASLNNLGAALSTWTLTDNTPLENFYTIQMQSEDTAGNQSGLGTIWRGLIDRVPPQVTATGVQGWVGNTAVTTYTLTLTDFLLDESTFDHPCTTNDLNRATYNDPILPHDGFPYQVTATCQVDGHQSSRTITACDFAGHCTNINLIIPDVHQLAITPLNQNDAQLSWTQPDATCSGYTVLRHNTPYFSATSATPLATTDSSTSLYDLPGIIHVKTPTYYKIDPQNCSGNTAVSNEVGVFAFTIYGENDE